MTKHNQAPYDSICNFDYFLSTETHLSAFDHCTNGNINSAPTIFCTYLLFFSPSFMPLLPLFLSYLFPPPFSSFSFPPHSLVITLSFFVWKLSRLNETRKLSSKAAAILFARTLKPPIERFCAQLRVIREENVACSLKHVACRSSG